MSLLQKRNGLICNLKGKNNIDKRKAVKWPRKGL